MTVAARPRHILEEGKTYTFSQIFELSFNVRDILAELGYSYEIAPLTLPRWQLTSLTVVDQVSQHMEKRRPRVSLDSESGRREFYVSPVLFNALDYANFDLNIEYNVVGDRLRGAVDYLLLGASQVVVIEAKLANMERGFTQLAAEMIALSEYLPDSSPIIYGAVTTGDLWQFGRLEVPERHITRDLNQYILPRDLAELFSIILGLVSR